MAATKNNKTNKNHILFRYGLITIVFLLFAMTIAWKLVTATIIEAPAWNERAHKELSVVTTIAPERGNILASNGNILACNLTVHDIKIDLRHDKIKKLSVIPWASIDSLADSLDVYYPRVSDLRKDRATYEKYSWHTRFREEFAKDPDKRNRALNLARKKTIDDFNRIKGFPFLKDFRGRGSRCPVYKEDRNIRIYPYGRMASRSIGRVNETAESREIHGYSGLEAALDTLLYGCPGLAKRVALNSGFSNWVAKPAVRGFDIHTTIDIDLQDMLEEELLSVCRESGAEWGTAILMEVATGEIKAISNVEDLGNGIYGEALNRAVLPFEPGSVMKPISLMIAFEDGLVHSVEERVDCSPFQRTTDPHAPGVKTMKQVIEMSSNTGIARVIFRRYAQKPETFHDRLASIGFFEPMKTGIAGECVPRVRRLVDRDAYGNNITMTSRHLDLARQAYGYNTEIPPLYTLSYYNAIANEGKYVRPHLVRSLTDENGRDSVMPITYIRDSVCSRSTAYKVKQCLHEVVWGEHGTARMVRDDRVKVVGKTGTAYPVRSDGRGYDTSRRRYAFAGFFPYETPRYSCMALVLAPGGTSANRTSGQVVKNMAVKMYSRGLLNIPSTYTQTPSSTIPVLAASEQYDSKSLTGAIGLKSVRKVKAPLPAKSGEVPDVVGYDAPTAVSILEKAGLNVQLRGSGRVVSQRPAAGAPLKHDGNITLFLRL